MAHSHAHSEPENTYFLDQLCTIAVGGLLGFTAIGLYAKGWLKSKFGLIDIFQIEVLIGGIILLVLTAVRALTVWRQAGQLRAAQLEQMEHDHDAHCGHDHGHSHAHGHAHGTPPPNGNHDGHDHGWSPWQYAVLIIPVVLFFLSLPADGYNMTRLNEDLSDQELEQAVPNKRIAFATVAGSAALHALKKPHVYYLKFFEMSNAASKPKERELLDGETVIVQGFIRKSRTSDKDFQLFRVMVTCCQTDSQTLRARMIAPQPLVGFNDMDWVSVEGEISFQKVAGPYDEWMPVIHIPSMDKIKKLPVPADPGRDS